MQRKQTWMDFLDSLECISTNKKSRRMQTWYMYEQYKSLERNQMEAAQKLRDQISQDRILHQEMAERRERRRLCDQPDCQSETGTESIKSEVKSCISASNYDFFESFCEIHSDEGIVRTVEHDLGSGDVSQEDSGTGQAETAKRNIEDYKSIKSVVDNFITNDNLVYNTHISHDNLADDIKEELEFVKKNIAENISLQLETVKENLQCLEDYTNYTNRCKSEQISKYDFECDSVYSTESQCPEIKKHDVENNMFAVWSKLVSFAYQVMQLNHGNCYYDYSFQFLTAVLACDVLRMGVCKMCKILQPYVSPVKIVNYECETAIIEQKRHKHVKRKKCVIAKKSRKNFLRKFLSHRSKTPENSYRCIKPHLSETSSIPCCCVKKHFNSEDSWGNCSSENQINEKKCLVSDRQRSVSSCYKMASSQKSSLSLWPEEYKIKITEDLSSCRMKVANPMLKLAGYIDEIFKEIEYPKPM